MFTEIKTAIAVTRFGIYASRYVEVYLEYFLFQVARSVYEMLDESAKLVEGFRCILVGVGNTHLAVHNVAGKIHQCDIQVMSAHIYPHKIG